MAYCRYCGRKLEEGEVCPCRQQSSTKQPDTRQKNSRQEQDYFSDMLDNVNMIYHNAWKGSSSGNKAYERGKKIVDDCVVPMEGEIPVRQYDIAILRTIFPHKRAEGRLQITNKRVIFRAAGRCHNGDICSEKEFQIDQISGIEIEKNKKANGWFLLLGILILLGAYYLGTLFGTLMIGNYYDPSKAAPIVGVLIACAGVAAVLFLKKWDWVKEIAFALSSGILFSYASIIRSYLIFLYSGSVRETFWRIVALALIVAAIVFLVLFSVKDDLTIRVKEEDALDALTAQRTVRRRRSPRGVYEGFSEVLPWTDTEAAIRELGALIQDVKQQGNAGIEKWRQ